MDTTHEVIIIGGGPAGLSAALLLGRCLRRVVVLDAQRPRNRYSHGMHAYLGHDGMPPLEFLRVCREQLQPYAGVSYVATTVADVRRDDAGFVARNAEGREWRAPALLMATGLVDRLPDVPGIADHYGVSVHHCPYCDAWEHRGRVLGVIGADQDAVDLACELQIWSPEVILFTHQDGPPPDCRHFPVVRPVTGRIALLEGRHAALTCVVMADGRRVACEALFFSPAQAQQCPLAIQLGCACSGESSVACEHVDGLFAAGNATRGIQLAIVAAADGIAAAAAINDWLMERNAAR